jgi:hypothetical protein
MTLKYHKNKNGLIWKVTGQHDPGEMGAGDSICNDCGREMKGCWNAVCFVCDKTFCYGCARASKNHWYCDNDYPHIKAEEYFARTNVR